MGQNKIQKGKVSVVIPTYNRLGLLDACLNSVFRQNYKRMEVIVIDDNSIEDIAQLIRRKYKKVKLISNNVNMGPAFSKNQGSILSKGEYILFLDSDSELIDKNSISNMVSTFKENEKTGSLGGEAVLDDKGKKIKVAGCGEKEYIYADKNNKIKECSFLNTSNCMIRKNVFQKVGGFDPYYFYPMEDADLGLAIRREGYINYVAFETGTLHKYSKSMRIERVYSLYKTKTRFLIKNYGVVRALINIPLDSKESILKPMFHFLKNRFSTTKNGTTEVIGPIEKGIFRKWYFFSITPFLLIRAYIWNIINFRLTIKIK